jgi:uncharacterized protein involved in propanediol utilization
VTETPTHDTSNGSQAFRVESSARPDGPRRAMRPRAATSALAVALRTGVASSIGQHGELIQGQLEDERRTRRRFLVSLPCDALFSKATFVPAPEEPLRVAPAHKQKVLTVASLTLAHLGHAGLGGSIAVESNIPEGKGYGSSTADCVAACLAVADALAEPLAEEEVAELVVTAETASDNFMFRRPVLFAHREGLVLEELGARMPRVEVLGVDTEIEGVVYTLDLAPATYDWRQVQCFHTLVAGMRRAVRQGDLRLLGRVATASALINQQFLHKPMFEDIRALSESVEALGIAVAHSGTVVSLLFDPGDPRLETRIKAARRGLESLGIHQVLRFQT